MDEYLSPSSSNRYRRGSYEPHLIGDEKESEPHDYLRRKSCPNPEVAQTETPSAPTIDILRKSVTVIRSSKMFLKTKPWNSDELIRRDGSKLPRSQSGSSSSICVSPLMSRTDLEQFEFFIPKSATMPTQKSAKQDSKELGQLDVTQYLSTEREFKEVGVQVKLGEVKFCLSYNENTEKLKLILKSIEITLKPSPTVVGLNWACDPITNMELLPDKKKPVEISFGSENMFDVKKSELSEKTLRLTIYDSRRKHANIPVGYVLLSLRDVPNIDKTNIHSKKINFHSQPAGFNKGNLLISLSWLVSTQKLEIKVGKGTNLKSPYGVDGKEHYVKVMVYIVGTKHKSFKTQMVKATPDVNFREKFVLPMNSSQLKDSSIVFHMYIKHSSKKMISNKVLTGRTIIGPYMKRKGRSLSQWEKIISTPVEEITEEHTLYL